MELLQEKLWKPPGLTILDLCGEWHCRLYYEYHAVYHHLSPNATIELLRFLNIVGLTTYLGWAYDIFLGQLSNF